MSVAPSGLSVAVVGLGRMGSAIAEAIARRGFRLHVYARTAAKAEPLVALGATAARSAAEAVAEADVVVTSLVDDASVTEVVCAESGLLKGMRAGAVHVGTTTISPRLADRVAAWHAEAGQRYVAGPVVGRRDLAEVGRLTTLAAGDPAAIQDCLPVLESYGPVRVVGERHSAANTLKLVVNFTTVSWIELMSEMYAFGEKNGLEPGIVHDMLVWIFDRPGLRNYAIAVRDRAHDEVGFELATGFKDVQLMLQAATDAQAPLPYAELIRSKMLTALAHGLSAKDWSVIYEVAREGAGLDSLL